MNYRGRAAVKDVVAEGCRRGVCLLLSVALLVSMCTALPASPAAAEPLEAGLSVRGNQLLKDGKPYLPRGFNMIGLLMPEWCEPTNRSQPIAAREHFGQAELDAAKSWHATMLRFQVSQRGLADPSLPEEARTTYLQRVIAGVLLARANGFDVIISMQEQHYGCGNIHPLPTAQTLDAWAIIAPYFTADPYIMFEMYNEPGNENDAEGWNQWLNGGSVPSDNLGDPAIGFQAMTEYMRSLGVPNVLIADGARNAARLSGMPLLVDPMGNLMYAIHPYYYPNQAWQDQQYGLLAASVPIIATEWSYTAKDCDSTKPALAPALLAYLRDRNIGVLGHAFDAVNTIVTDDWSWTPTDCASASGGAGRDLLNFFTALAAAEDNAVQSAPPAPSQLQATAVDHRRVDLSWQPAAAEAGQTLEYTVLRDGVVLGRTGGTSFSDSTVQPQTAYGYTVYATDTSNKDSAAIHASVMTPEPPDVTPPQAPQLLTARVVSPDQVALSWQPAEDDRGVVGYRITRDTYTIASTPEATYIDVTMSSGKPHTYVIYARDAAGNESVASTQQSVYVPYVAPSGLTATYFATATLTTPKLTRIDPSINFSWGTAAPAARMGADTFSVRWTGKLIPLTNETYTFYTQSDDGVRLWVNGKLLIDKWAAHALREDKASIALTANKAYDIKVEYYDKSGGATMKLLWGSASVPKQVVPKTQLLAR